MIDIKIPLTETASLWIIGFIILSLNGYSIYYQFTNNIAFYYEPLETTPNLTVWTWMSIAGEITIIGFMLYDKIIMVLPEIRLSFKFKEQNKQQFPNEVKQ